MARTYSYLTFRDDETPVMLTYGYRPGSAPVYWGDCPDPGSMPEIDIIEAKDRQGRVVDLSQKERSAFKCEILEEHDATSPESDREHDTSFELDRSGVFDGIREEIHF